MRHGIRVAAGNELTPMQPGIFRGGHLPGPDTARASGAIGAAIDITVGPMSAPTPDVSDARASCRSDSPTISGRRRVDLVRDHRYPVQRRAAGRGDRGHVRGVRSAADQHSSLASTVVAGIERPPTVARPYSIHAAKGIGAGSAASSRMTWSERCSRSAVDHRGATGPSVTGRTERFVVVSSGGHGRELTNVAVGLPALARTVGHPGRPG